MADSTPNLTLTAFSNEDDLNPSTFLDSLLPPDYVIPTPDKFYEFALPNFVDEMPIKYMRLQLTWTGNPAPPLDIPISGVDGIDPVPGDIVFTSPITTTATGAFYQYYDIEFKPNPDSERWLVYLPDNAFLVQAVADTVSTVPEPATLTLLALGSLSFLLFLWPTVLFPPFSTFLEKVLQFFTFSLLSTT